LEALVIQESILKAWTTHWGENVGIPGRPIPPDPGSQAVGGYWCYDWTRIFHNALAAEKLKCFSVIDVLFFYEGFDPTRERNNVHFYLEIKVCGNATNPACTVKIDDGFFGTGFIHNDDFPISVTGDPADIHPIGPEWPTASPIPPYSPPAPGEGGP
jgi:hypothetical protein